MNNEILTRSDGVFADVDSRQRIIDLIAVPWEQEARVFWRGEYWSEVFIRGAFKSIRDLTNKIRVNREHRKGDTVGKVIEFDPDHERGLFARVKVVHGPKGDELLHLAQEDMVSASIGYATRKLSDVALDKTTKTRRVKEAFLDHIAMVEDPAYVGAEVLAVREKDASNGATGGPLPATPSLDEILRDPVIVWVMEQKRVA